MSGAQLLAANDLSALRISGLPTSARSLRRLAERSRWDVQRGAGGVLLIDIKSLSAAQVAEISEKLVARGGMAFATAKKPARQGARIGRPEGSAYFTLNPEAANCVLAALSTHKFAAPRVLEIMAAHGFAELPSLRALQRFIKKLEAQRIVELTQMRDPDRARSKYQLALGRMDGGESFAHETWELDTTKFDLMLDGFPRQMVLGLIDRWSRRAHFLVAPSESGQSARHLLIGAIEKWGVIPTRIVVDNGSGYINKSIRSACEILGIELKVCLPGKPEFKPFVERLFGRVTRERAVLLEGFSGSNVAEAQRLRGRARKETRKAKVVGSHTPETLQILLSNWVVGVYEQTVHSGIGMSPLAKAMRTPAPARAAPDEQTVKRALTAFVGNLVVGKKGLRWKSTREAGHYWCDALVGYIGKTVHVRRDEDNLGVLLAFSEHGDFIGEAVDWQRAGLSQRAFAISARDNQRKHDKAAEAYLREQQKNYPMEKAWSGILRSDAEKAGKLAVLPIRAARPEATPQSPTQSQSPATIHRFPVEARPRADIACHVARAEQILFAQKSGQVVSEDDAAWASAFKKGSAFAAFKAQAAIDAGERPVISISSRRVK
jgi:putative transposase